MKFMVVKLVMLAFVGTLLMPAPAVAQTETYFVPITPCRLVDTRQVGGRFGGGTVRDYYVWGDGLDVAQGGAGNCGVPSNVLAVHVNLTSVNSDGFGYIRAWPFGTTEPKATLMAFNGAGISNATALGTCGSGKGCTYDISVKVYGALTHFAIDIVGYYVPTEIVVAGQEQTER